MIFLRFDDDDEECSLNIALISHMLRASYVHTVYVSCSHCLSSKLKLELEMDSWRNSHSPWVFITSWEYCVARDELEEGTRRISSTRVREVGENLSEARHENMTDFNAHPSSPQCIPEPMVMLHFCVSKGNLWTSIWHMLTTFMTCSEVTVPSYDMYTYGNKARSSFCILRKGTNTIFPYHHFNPGSNKL